MILLSIDPSSTVLGYAVFNEDDLISWGEISTKAVKYEQRYMHIVGWLTQIAAQHNIDELACERAVRFEGKKVPALEVAVTSINKWAERRKLKVHFYSPREWKVSITGHGDSDKNEVARVICLYYQQLPGDVSNHITDAVGIGQHHLGIKRLLMMSEDS